MIEELLHLVPIPIWPSQVDGLVLAAGRSGRSDKVEFLLNEVLQPSDFTQNEQEYYNLILKGAVQKDRLTLVKTIIGETSLEDQRALAWEALEHNSRNVATWLIKLNPQIWSKGDLVSLLPSLIRKKYDDVTEDVLKRLQGQRSLPINVIRAMALRQDKDFLSIAPHLLVHMSEYDLDKLMEEAEEADNSVLFSLVSDLLSSN